MFIIVLMRNIATRILHILSSVTIAKLIRKLQPFEFPILLRKDRKFEMSNQSPEKSTIRLPTFRDNRAEREFSKSQCMGMKSLN